MTHFPASPTSDARPNRRTRRLTVATCAAAIATLTISACGEDTSQPSDAPSAGSSVARDSGGVRVTDVMVGLDHPWDVALDSAGNVVTGERSGRIVMRHNDGRVATVDTDISDVDAKGEAGLMGLALARDFDQSRSVFTCYASDAGDVRVVRSTASPDWATLRRAQDVITGLPLGASGRHSGCRVLPAADGTLFVSTGDTANPTAPQDTRNLGGKVLHINADGTPADGTLPGSPVHSLGHRNPQGMAFQPGTGRLYTTEHGPDTDDELNLERPQANYGWDPDTGTGAYDESVPMTDTRKHPGSVPAVWSTGAPTLAIADLDFLGSAWKQYSGMVVIAALKAKKLVLLRLDADGTRSTEQVDLLTDQQGRLRSITPTPDGSLLVTTDNGGGEDKVIKVSPA